MRKRDSKGTEMEKSEDSKIALVGLKVDFHIHSIFSKHKDGEIVKNNTIENIPILIKRLEEEQVEMCSISDHDTFSFQMYSELKKFEGQGKLKKVFPAVEFSVLFQRAGGLKRVIHVICVFNDSDLSKVEKIDIILQLKDGHPEYDFEEKAYTERKFLELLDKIKIDVVLIAHQKKSLTSTQSPDENDANSLGNDSFNEFVFSEYFEAYEFHNKRNEVFNNAYKCNFNTDLLRFITGSDCHDWTFYPKSRADDKNIFCHTYFKCLPTFRGVSLALTDESRIQLVNNFYSQDDSSLDTLEFTIAGKEKKIELSRGINVIIGDNSVGKSLLLHKMTNYLYGSTKSNSKIREGYDSYLIEKKVDVITEISQDNILLFDTQGEIRQKFNLGHLKASEFFKDKYPEDIDTTMYKSIIREKINQFCNSLENKFIYDEKCSNIREIKIYFNNEILSNFNLVNISPEYLTNEQEDLNKLIVQMNKSTNELNNLLLLSFDEKDKDYIKSFIQGINLMKDKYVSRKLKITNQKTIANFVNIAFDSYEKSIESAKTNNETATSKYENEKSNLVDSILSSFIVLRELKPFSFNIQEVDIGANVNEFLKYKFVSKIAIVSISKEYLETLVRRPMKANFKFDLMKITKESFLDGIKDSGSEVDPIKCYKEKIENYISSDFKPINTIVEDDMDIQKTLSAGFNVKIYYSILSTQKNRKGIYIIDQPEDDVSQRAIKNFILTDFKRMSKNRQVIIVTHNPQFVVNIDADNVIHVGISKEGEFELKSGSLEYECSEYKILDLVAESLDGGLETIRKRWKRYEKNIEF